MVSIIIPVANTNEFIDRCLRSVTEQTYKNIEIIVIIDKSTDGSKERVISWMKKDKRIKLFENETQRGVGYSRNKGIDLATGSYLYFLDSDDYLSSHTIEKLMEHSRSYDIVNGKQITVHTDEHTETYEDEPMEQVQAYKYDLIKNFSVLNRLYNRNFVDEHHLRFSEEVQCYSDLPFIVQSFASTDTVSYVPSAVYFKRRRNDPISNPALMQMDFKVRISELMYLLKQLKLTYTDNELIQNYIARQFLRVYRRSIVHYFRKNENVAGIFHELVNICKDVKDDILKESPFFIRREINILKKGNIDAFKKVNLWHHRLRKIKRAVRSKRNFFVQLYRTFFLRRPLHEKTIVFESFLGKSYSDSPKYIYEQMLRENKDYTFVWSVEEKKNIPGNPIQVRRFSLKYFYYMAIAKYWVSNSRLPRFLHKREGNIYLQTWHGTPLKRLVFDMDDVHSADPNYKRNFFRQSRRWDYLISPNEYSSEIFKRAFKYDGPMLEIGYPRNDILYKKNNETAIATLKKKMNLPDDKKVILYAPTWRDDEFYERGKYKFELQLELNKLQKQLGDDYVVVLRMHYFIASSLDISAYEGFAFDFSAYDDIAELYLISDILITDYSSVFFDYAHLKRPILFYTYDLERYRDTLRGFYIDMEKDVPGPLLKTTDDIVNSIVHIDEVRQKYKKKYEEFYEKFCSWDDGKAADAAVEKVFLNRQRENS